MVLKIIFVFVIILSVMSGLFYLYYKSSQETIATLHQNNAKLEVAMQTQQATIKNLKTSFDKQILLAGKLQVKLLDAENGYKKLSSKLRRHDLEELSRVKPKLMEKRINRGTKRLLKELESISGFTQPTSN